MNLILASSSISRRKQLTVLDLPFDWIAPDIDESPLADESAFDLVMRLSLAKAETVAKTHPDSLIIAGDQVCDFAGEIIGKPFLEMGNLGKGLQITS